MTDPTVAATDTKSFSGNFLLYRKTGGKLSRPGVKTRAREPRFRHPTFAAAEGEAKRLLEHHPESTFVILQEVARVKLKDPDAISGCADDQSFASVAAETVRGVADAARDALSHA